MKTHLFNAMIVVMLFLMPNAHYGQAPNLGAASGFALFTSVGAFNALGDLTTVTGDVGTNVGAFTGFPPGVLFGSIHTADAVTAAAAPDVATAYSYLSNLTCGLVIGTTLGGGQLLTPNIYCMGAASTLNGNLTLDGQNDPNAIFVFKIDGAMATSTLSNVLLINMANACNVFWQINGEFTMGEGSVFRGMVLNNGAIHLLEGSSLFGVALSQAGAIDLHNSIVSMGAQPVASVIVPGGETTFCEGNRVVLSGNNGGIWSTGATSESITVNTAGDYFVTNSNGCGSAESNHILVTVNPMPLKSTIIADGATTFCEGSQVILSGNTGGTWNTGVTTESITVTTSGDYFVTNTNNCGSVNSNHIAVIVDQQVIASTISPGGATTFCAGESVTLSGNIGGTWSTGATTESIIVTTAGDYFVTNSNGCGSAVSNHILVTVNPSPILVTNPQEVCSPNRVDLTAPEVTAGSSFPANTTLTYWTNSSATIEMLTPTIAGNGTYYIKAETAPGCTDIKPVTVIVDPLPIVYNTTGNGSYCEGGSGLVVGLSGSQVGVSYSISLCAARCPLITTVEGTGGPISFGLQTVPGYYSIFAQNNITNCGNWMYNCIIISVDPILPVSVSILPSANPVPAGTPVTFTAAPVNGGDTPIYQWLVNGLNEGTNSATFSFVPVNGDVVSVMLTSSESCVSGNPYTSSPITMEVVFIPPTINATGIILSGQNTCYSATNTLVVAGNGTTFIVQDGGSAIMVAGQNILFMPGTIVLPGGYLHGYISDLYCLPTAPSMPKASAGSGEPSVMMQNRLFSIYPNPSNGNFTLEQHGERAFNMVKVEMYGMCGERLITEMVTGDKNHEFWLSGLQQGLYFIKIVADENVETFKLIITR